MLKVYFLKKDKDFLESSFSKVMASKYKDENANSMSSFAWNSLERILKKEMNLTLKEEDIVFNKFNKPFLKNEQIYFSLSHYNQYVAVAISDSDVGVDIEGKIEKSRADKLITRMSDKIKEEYDNEIDKEDYFTSFWARNESYIKREGIGLDTTAIDVEIDEEICANEFVFNDDGKEIYLCVINANNELLESIYKEI